MLFFKLSLSDGSLLSSIWEDDISGNPTEITSMALFEDKVYFNLLVGSYSNYLIYDTLLDTFGVTSYYLQNNYLSRAIKLVNSRIILVGEYLTK